MKRHVDKLQDGVYRIRVISGRGTEVRKTVRTNARRDDKVKIALARHFNKIENMLKLTGQ